MLFWEKFVGLCASNNTKPNPVAAKLGVSSAAVTKWKNGSMPNDVTLHKIATYFGVSIDYLKGNTDDPNQKPGETNIRFDEFEFAMHNETKDLSDDDKNMLLDMARILKNRVIEKNKSKD